METVMDRRVVGLEEEVLETGIVAVMEEEEVLETAIVAVLEEELVASRPRTKSKTKSFLRSKRRSRTPTLKENSTKTWQMMALT
jgi:hypothetical protein